MAHLLVARHVDTVQYAMLHNFASNIAQKKIKKLSQTDQAFLVKIIS
jgi:hypothetical protein